MIKLFNKEYVEEGVAVRHITYYFLNIKIYEAVYTTTRNDVIRNLTT